MSLAPAWMVVIIVGREFIVSGLRSILAVRGVAMSASRWGKLKTFSQVVAIVLLIFTNTLNRLGEFEWVAIVALWISMVLALVSAWGYVVRFLHFLPELASEPAQSEAASGEAARR